MTKRNFIMLGDYVRKNRGHFPARAIDVLADCCAASNPAFKRERWIDYVFGVGGPNGGEVKAQPEKPAKHQPYQPKTGQRCSCKPGVHRDNCPACEGTGMVIDFAAIRARKA